MEKTKKYIKILPAVVLALSMVAAIFVTGCSQESKPDYKKQFDEEYAEATADSEQYAGDGWVGDWYLSDVNTGDFDENGEYIWDAPDYIETMKIEASGSTTDTVGDDSILGYVHDVDREAGLFTSTFYYENPNDTTENALLDIDFTYDPTTDAITVNMPADDGTTVSICTYRRGVVEEVTMQEDGTYVDKDGNVVDITEGN